MAYICGMNGDGGTNVVNGKEWMFSYHLSDDNKGVITYVLRALPAWGEKGEYTLEECRKLEEWIHSQPVPEFKDEYPWGGKTYREWDEFVNNNKLKMRELLK